MSFLLDKLLYIQAGISSQREILKDVFCQPSTPANADSALQDRDVRKALWRRMRDLVTQNLESCFSNGELAGIDLYGMDFRRVQLAGVSLNNSFLVESDFGHADLQGALLSGSRIRNVNFADTCLSGADMTDADWYNATGLTAQQLAVVKPGTLRRCPAAVKGIIDSLADDYAYPFGNWSRRIQLELQETWKRHIEDESFLRWRAQ